MRGGTRAGLVLLPFLCRPPRAPISLCAVPPQPAPPQLLVPSSQPLLDLPPLQTERQGHQGGRSVKQHKVRQHVNPLRTSHQTLLDLDDGWTASAFADPTRHLHVDIGCARGLWCLDLAQRRPDWNVLGLEIRQVLADAAQEDASALQLRNLRFFPCNANVNLDAMLAKAEAAGTILNSASLQFPDPWFKAKHHKRRTLQPPLIRTLASRLAPGGWVLFQTDVLDLAVEMRQWTREHAGGILVDQVPDESDWGVTKPAELLGLTTERERACFELSRPIYRCLFRKPE